MVLKWYYDVNPLFSELAVRGAAFALPRGMVCFFGFVEGAGLYAVASSRRMPTQELSKFPLVYAWCTGTFEGFAQRREKNFPEIFFRRLDRKSVV